MNNLHSQTPPSPPTPPNVNVDSNNGITHSEAESKSSYAFSCAFEERHISDIKKIIREEFKDFSKDMFSKNEKFEIKIELRKTELKMEYKSFDGEISEDKNKLKSIASKIIAL